MIKVAGNTYPVKDRLHALGGRWNSAAKCWEVPDDKVEEASTLLYPASSTAEAIRLATEPWTTAPRRARQGPRTCRTCGRRINYGEYCGKCEYR